MPSPEATDCCFCGAALTPADVLRFETAMEAYYESDAANAIVGDDSFIEEPAPTCARCRASIGSNRQKIREESDYEARDNSALWILTCGSAVAIVLHTYS